MVTYLDLARIMFNAYNLPMKEAYRNLNTMGYDVAGQFGVLGASAVYLEADDGAHLAVVPGTNQLTDWFFFNFRAYPLKKHDGRWFHRGFSYGAHLIMDWILSKTPALIVGHSLGGGIGQVISAHVDIPVVTFGAPKVLCQCSERCNSNCTNLILPNDPVPQEPRDIFLLSWDRAGKDKVLKINPKHQMFWHRMAHYIAALEEYPENNT